MLPLAAEGLCCSSKGIAPTWFRNKEVASKTSSPRYLSLRHHRLSRPTSNPFRYCTTLKYTLLEDDSEDVDGSANSIHSHRFFLDTSNLIPNERDQVAILEWIETLSGVERSDPTWIDDGDFLTTLSPSSLLQEHLESLLPLETLPQQQHSVSQALFPNEWSRHKFDFDWRASFLKCLPTEDLTDILEHQGKSNTHPLRFQLVAIPPETALSWHAHPAIEFNIPLLGQMWERVPLDSDDVTMQINPDMLQRQWEQQLGSPLSVNKFSLHPTTDELAIISKDLSNRVNESLGINAATLLSGKTTERVIVTGQCMVNTVGSIHQSFTKTDDNHDFLKVQRGEEKSRRQGGCLLWALGPNVHANFFKTDKR